ncbi:hypothetical protein Tco_0807356 [Tanacetum coccineum]
MAPMASSDAEVKTCSKTCLNNYEALKKQYDDLLVKLSDTDFKAATYKRGLATLEGSKEYELGLLRTELEKVKQEKEGFDFKIAKFDKSAKDLDKLLGSQITDKSKKGFGYNVVPSPHPLILNRPTTLDLSYSGLEEFKEPEVNEYGPRDSSLKPTTGCDKESDNSKENTDDSLEQHQMTDTETSSFESPLKVDKDWKEKFFYPANHVESVNQIEKPVKRTVRYADKSLVKEQESQVKSSFVEGCGSNTSKNVSEVEPKKVRKNNDTPIIEDWVSDDEEQDGSKTKPKKKTVIPIAAKIEKPVRKPVRYAEMYSCPNQQRKRIVSGNNYNKKDNDYYSKTSHPSAHKHMAPRAVLMKTGLKSFNTARPINTVRSVNTDQGLERIYKKRTKNKAKTTKPDTEWKSMSNSQLNEKGFVDSGCSRHMTRNITHLSDFQVFYGGYVTFGGGAYGHC